MCVTMLISLSALDSRCHTAIPRMGRRSPSTGGPPHPHPGTGSHCSPAEDVPGAPASVIAARPVPFAGLQVAVELDAFVRRLPPVRRPATRGRGAAPPALAGHTGRGGPARGGPPTRLV